MADTNNNGLMNKSVNQFSGGLHSDNSPVMQPKGSMRFALNAATETEIGDMSFITNLESNEAAGKFPDGYTPIGKCYMIGGETVIFLVGPNGESEIGIYKDSGEYETKVNDKDQETKLEFKITHQIDATYRLRRGCDKTIYWTDNINPVRHYIFNKEEDYQIKKQGVTEWDIEAFSLFKRWNKTPIFEDVRVLENGSLKAGSYNLAIQYLDADLNPTEWLVVSDTIAIYHDSLKKNYKDIEGSTSTETSFQSFGKSTGKAISVNVRNLDTSFPFYRLGLIEATNGSGKVSKVTVSTQIPTEITKHIFDNNNGQTITIEEIGQFSLIIETAQSLEQLENRLLLGNVKGKQIDFCDLQQYASKIIANYEVEKVILNDFNSHKSIESAASKNPLVNLKKVGYMPGEIYSFGIVYYFKDGSTSPVYHIPGKSPKDTRGISNMSDNNELEVVYTDSSNCEDKDFWKTDYLGNALKGEKIRHHRFPTREEANIGFVNEEILTSTDTKGYIYEVGVSIPALTPKKKDTEEETGGTEAVTEDKKPEEVLTFTVNIAATFTGGYTINKSISVTRESVETYVKVELGFREELENPTISFTTSLKTIPDGLSVKLLPAIETSQSASKIQYTANILGINFSNISVPKLKGRNEIIGYKIVRNERTENEKTILDTGILFPVSKFENFISYAHSVPSLRNANFQLKKNVYAFIHPEFLFNSREYNQRNIHFVLGGEFVGESKEIRNASTTRFKMIDRIYENFINDAYPGTTYDASVHKKEEADYDGLSLHTVSKVRETNYLKGSSSGKDIFKGKIRDIYYLDSLSSKNSTEENTDIFNISSDNKIGIVELTEDIPDLYRTEKHSAYVSRYYPSKSNFIDRVIAEDPEADTEFSAEYFKRVVNTLKLDSIINIPYFYLKRDVASPYADFRYLPFYNEHQDIKPASRSASGPIFHGDSYISPMTYNNSFFHDIKPKDRKTKTQWWKYLLGGIAIVAGIIAAIVTGGAGSTVSAILIKGGIGLLGAAAGLSLIKSGLEGDKLAEIYQRKYEEGLKHLTRDTVTNGLLVNPKIDAFLGLPMSFPMEDDEIQWYNDVITGLWFESQVNFGLRQGVTIGLPDFIEAPIVFEEIPNNTPNKLIKAANAYAEKFRRRAVEKISVLDTERDQARLYQGFATAEFYEVNKDYARREREKPFFALGLEYDCCSDCIETFPHRIHYSEQSFQEENTDNYRIFLPNNYRDINGETGAITNIFKIQNNLYVHTEEAIWNLPRNYQERITDQVVSFIGTGDYFSIPPQKLVDDTTGNSYGTKHKWSRLKTPYGYFFVCESQNCICQFNGNKVDNLSDKGLYYWFYNNVPLHTNSKFKDNPSNPNGAGFIAVYDSKKELVFFTKKDRLASGEDASWTISYSLKRGVWNSFHSFLPNFYIQTSENYFSWINKVSEVWKHNIIGKYQSYYGDKKSFIIEYVINDEPLVNKIFNDITIHLESRKYDSASQTFYDTSTDFFTKLLAYTARQCTGVVDIVVKDKEDMSYIGNQTTNPISSVIADRVERDWHINELRDMVVLKNASMFTEKIDELQDNYFIDKELNTGVINFNKDWFQIENMRDKYLVVRFIFDKFDDVKLITNFTLNNETQSLR